MGGKLINQDKFFAIKQSSYIAQIAAPLNYLKITYFNHIRIFDDLSRISLANRPDWLMHFYKANHYNRGIYSSHPTKYTSTTQYHLWLASKQDGVREDANANYNIANGFTIIKSQTGYKDFFLFGSSRENYSINNFYLNNIDILEHFISFYREKTNKIIIKCIPDLYILNNTSLESNKMTLEDDLYQYNKNSFYANTTVKRYYHQKNKIYLTKREQQIVNLLLTGLTNKEVTTCLGISYRTLLGYLNNAKLRLNVYSNESLLNYFRRNNNGITLPQNSI